MKCKLQAVTACLRHMLCLLGIHACACKGATSKESAI